MTRVGILTGGGDCPGLNAVISAVVRKSTYEGMSVVGIMRGWAGLLEMDTVELDAKAVSGIVHRGGTILRTSRTNPFKKEADAIKLVENYKKMGLDALIAVGGDDTLGVANKMHQRGLPVVGVPKTIDNDLSGTDCTFGFDTAVNIAMEAIDRLHTTAESHNRVMVVELMGREAGWITLHAGIAGGADLVLIPEYPMSIEEICSYISARHKKGKSFSIVAVAEGFTLGGHEVTKSADLDAFGHAKLGGVGTTLGGEIEKRTGFETRVTVLGHIQRGGSPTAFDRFLGVQFGVKAADLVKAKDFGKMVSKRGNEITAIPLADAVSKNRLVDSKLYDMAKVFFG